MISPKHDYRRRTTGRLPPARLGAAAAPSIPATLHLEQLHEISQLLTAFESVERTFPLVVAVVAKALPLRSAVLVLKGYAATTTTVWTPEGSSRDGQAVTARAEAAFAYLTDQPSPGPRGLDIASVRQRFLSLPLVVDVHKTFGVLQLEGDVRDEVDLQFANAVANQLAVALRRSVAEAERESLLVSERHARAEAESANRAKDEFLAILSHELRTPLNAITGWAHLLRIGVPDPAQIAKAIEVIARNAEIQRQLIEDILDVHHIVAGKLRLESDPVDLGAVVESACDTVKPAADRKEIEIRLSLDPEAGPMVGDPDRLRQVVWNLLSNAIKFTPKGGHVGVTLRSADEGHVEITVADDGPGIPPGFLPHVFDRFRQADPSRSRRHGGLGLGLAIAERIVTLHHGTIRAANGSGGGAVFTVRLPGAAPAAMAEGRGNVEATARETISLDGIRVLVVDDAPDDRDVLAKILEQHGAEVLVASSAGEGFRALERERPHVLLSDISMPDEDGYAFLRRVRELPAERGGLTPAAAVTAFAGADESEHALAAGFQAHLAKPVDARALATLVSGLAVRTMRRERR
jgi:signal transduction histidine kinase/ActR/RegA family two-component response regulator